MYDLERYNYDLPPAFIAQLPTEKRDHSKLMVLDKVAQKIKHRQFADLAEYLRPGDLLVFNNSKVIPARILGRKVLATGLLGAKVEVLLLKQQGETNWECLVRPGKRLKPGSRIVFGKNLLSAEVLEETSFGGRILRFFYSGDFNELLKEVGLVPLPPYINTEKAVTVDHPLAERYQTVYAEFAGSSAAPTAGLHFTKELLNKIEKQGVQSAFVTLHTGLGTFRPVETPDIRQHQMHSEWFEIKKETVEKIRKVKQAGGRVIAVGTTAVRVLESVRKELAAITPASDISGETNIFIFPTYSFEVVDCLVTNFHLPKSSLLMLVSALAGCDFVLRAYEEAKRNNYRFFSFGDAMLIV